jgi:hypothetical protein
VKITPDLSGSYVTDDALPQARSMANFIALPNGKVLNLNGAGLGMYHSFPIRLEPLLILISILGTAGYGNDSWAIGHSYADQPVLTPVIYDPNAPKGSRWSADGLQASTVPRLYHSSALLLPDGKSLLACSHDPI